MRRNVLVALCLCAALSARADELGDKLEKAVLAEAPKFWGAVLVARGDQVLLSKGFGKADLKKTPNTEDSLFDVGSVAKQFTAAGVLVLESQGKLSIDDPISKYFPNVPEDKRAITIKQVLSHTAGFWDGGEGEEFQGKTASRAKMVAAILGHALDSKPGTAWNYSNLDYFLAAALIEKVSGEKFEDFMKKSVFKPAGMTSTGFVQDASLDKKRATVRVSTEGRRKMRTDAIDYSWDWGEKGATGVITSAKDLLAWHRALGGAALLPAKQKDELFGAVMKGYALGWFVDKGEDGKIKSMNHDGSTRGYSSYLARVPGQDAVVVVLTDEDTNPVKIGEQLVKDLLANPPAKAAEPAPKGAEQPVRTELPGTEPPSRTKGLSGALDLGD